MQSWMSGLDAAMYRPPPLPLYAAAAPSVMRREFQMVTPAQVPHVGHCQHCTGAVGALSVQAGLSPLRMLVDVSPLTN